VFHFAQPLTYDPDETRGTVEDRHLDALAESLQETYDLLPIGVVLVDTNGLIVLTNRSLEGMLGYARAELMGRSVESLVPSHLETIHRAARQDYVRSAMTRRMGAGRELSALHRNGSMVPVEVGLTPITRGFEVYVLGTIIDVSERRKLEEQLQQVQKDLALGKLAAGIAHDFNNILLGILGYAELALESAAQGSDIQSYLREVIDNAHRGRDLVGRVLNFARQKDTVRSAVNWDEVVRNSLRLMRVALPGNVTIHVSTEPEVPPVWANPIDLQQIFMNLMTNAIDASPEGGVIEVRIRAEGEAALTQQPRSSGGSDLCVCMSVIDQGIGIPQRIMEQIFEP
jgi:PAS domain S-box-containing protein